MDSIRNAQLSEKIIWLLTIALFASFSIFDEKSWVSILLFTITVLIFVIDAIQGSGKIIFCFDYYHLFVLIFCVFCFISSIWAWDSSLAIEKGKTIFEILICTSIVYSHYSKHKNISLIVDAVMWAGYVVVVYAILFYGLDTLKSLVSGGGRLDSGFTNINSIGMIAAITVVITLYKIIIVEQRIHWTYLFVIPAILFTGISGSRKALLIVAIGLTLILMKKYGSKNIIRSLIRWIIIILVIIVLFKILFTLPIFDTVSRRMRGLIAMLTGNGQIDSSSLLRKQYIQLGLEQFKRTPILGIGMDNSRLLIRDSYIGRDTYLHNNYVELLADGGIVGFLSYYTIPIYALVKMYKYHKIDDSNLTICAVLLFIFLVMDFGGISYYSKSRYFYYLFFYLEINKLAENSEASVWNN